MAKTKKAKADREPEVQTPPADQPAAPTETISKSEAVRRAVAAGADKPAEGVAFIKEQFGLDVTPAAFSTYKANAKGKAGGISSGGRAAKGDAASGSDATDAAAVVRDVKSLVDKYGAETVKGLVDVFRE